MNDKCCIICLLASRRNGISQFKIVSTFSYLKQQWLLYNIINPFFVTDRVKLVTQHSINFMNYNDLSYSSKWRITPVTACFIWCAIWIYHKHKIVSFKYFVNGFKSTIKRQMNLFFFSKFRFSMLVAKF